jgi:hypothetical protein
MSTTSATTTTHTATATEISSWGFPEILAWERTLRPGDIVEGRWTNCHSFHVARCEVVRVNGKSIRLRALEGYLEDRSFPVPRVLAGTWSNNNCAAPITT